MGVRGDIEWELEGKGYVVDSESMVDTCIGGIRRVELIITIYLFSLSFISVFSIHYSPPFCCRSICRASSSVRMLCSSLNLFASLFLASRVSAIFSRIFCMFWRFPCTTGSTSPTDRSTNTPCTRRWAIRSVSKGMRVLITRSCSFRSTSSSLILFT